jgi:hypothetical protein
MDCQGVGAIACDRLEDGISSLGPDEGLWVGIVDLNECGDVGFEIVDAAMDAALDLLVGEEGEPAFDLVQPGGAGRGEVEVIARVAGEPCFDGRGLVGGVIVEHKMDVEVGRHGLLDLGQELAEFDRAVTLVAAGDDVAGGDIQSGEQRGDAVTVGAVADGKRGRINLRLEGDLAAMTMAVDFHDPSPVLRQRSAATSLGDMPGSSEVAKMTRASLSLNHPLP